MIDHRKVRAAVLLMHFDEAWVGRILDFDDLGLSVEEKKLFVGVDRRGFRADGERKARAVAAVLDEFPVAVAVAGLPRAFSLFTSAVFVDVAIGNCSLVEAAARHLDNVPARIELALAQARRRRDVPGWAAAAGVAVARVPVGSLERYAAARRELGPAPSGALAAGKRVAWPAASDDDDAVLVTGADVSACSPPLAELLSFAATTRSHEELVLRACDLGCDTAEEAVDLIADLVTDGLLVPAS